jgi:hypothetical protein
MIIVGLLWLDIKQRGNNLGVRLSVADGHIIITPVFDELLIMERLLANYDPARTCGCGESFSVG